MLMFVSLPVWCQSPVDKSGVKPNVISLPSGAGSIEGLGESFEPQLNTGSSTYGIAIASPPGRAGLNPSVRLTYDSNAGNGIGGIGWNLEFPSIKRQTDKGFPEYDSGDTFVYQGEELVPINNSGRDWRCENERSFQRFRRIDADSDSVPDAWEITERNGTRHSLGQFRGNDGRWSVVEHPEKLLLTPFDRTYCWMLDSTTDVHGNRVDYEYVLGSGMLYPSRISYSQLGDASHEVLFEYESRPDVFDDYRPTFSARLDRRLIRVEVRSQGQLVRAYNFGYDYLPGDLFPDAEARLATYLDLGVTLLKRVVQVDRSGSDANYLPPLVFTYSGLDLNEAELRAFVTPPELDLAESTGRIQLADLDGDGLPDLFSTQQEGAALVQRVCLNRGESSSPTGLKLAFDPSRVVLGASPVDIGQPNSVLHDPKGKGLVDVSSLTDDGGNKRLDTYANRARLDVVDENFLGFSEDLFESVVLQNPPQFVSYSDARTRQMDVNFDKRSDFIYLEPSFGSMKANLYYGAMHLTPVSLFDRNNSRFCLQFSGQHRLQMHRLIHKSVKQQPARTGSTPIESEREFVQIVIQVGRLHGSLVRPQQPTLQQGRHTVRQRQQVFPQGWRRTDDFVFVSQLFQSIVTLPSVGVDRAAGIHSLRHGWAQVVPACTGNASQPNTPDTFACLLRGDHDQRFACRSTASLAGSFPTNEDLVHFHDSGQAIPTGTHHGPPQFVQPVPRGVIAAKAQDSLQPQSAGPIFLTGDVPHRFEPKPKGFMCVGEQRARRDRNVPLTALTAEHAPLHFPKLSTAAPGASPSLWPTQLNEVVAAGVFGTKLIAKFQKVLRVLGHAGNLAKL
jgi:hypothetical protein